MGGDIKQPLQNYDDLHICWHNRCEMHIKKHWTWAEYWQGWLHTHQSNERTVWLCRYGWSAKSASCADPDRALQPTYQCLCLDHPRHERTNQLRHIGTQCLCGETKGKAWLEQCRFLSCQRYWGLFWQEQCRNGGHPFTMMMMHGCVHGTCPWCHRCRWVHRKMQWLRCK